MTCMTKRAPQRGFPDTAPGIVGPALEEHLTGTRAITGGHDGSGSALELENFGIRKRAAAVLRRHDGCRQGSEGKARSGLLPRQAGDRHGAGLDRRGFLRGVGAAVDSTLLPCSRSLRAAVTPPEARRFALAGGDDYELLFALPPGTDAAALGRGAGVGLARIGEFRAGRGVIIDGEPAPGELAAGFDHFASPRPGP